MIRAPIRFAALLAAMLATPAQAACDAANTYTLSFASYPAMALAYDTEYPVTITSSAGGSRSIKLQMAQNGLSSTQVNGAAYPRVNTLFSGADGGNNLVMGGVFANRNQSMDGTSRMMTLTITFDVPVRDVAITMNDVDFSANQYRDFVKVVGGNTVNGAAVSYTPVLTTPWGQSSATGGTRTSNSSSLAVGSTTQNGIVVDPDEALGRSTADSGTDTGTLFATFAQPVRTVTVKYGNAPYTSGENTTGQQAIGFEAISFCPMPAIAMTKKSTPVTSTLGAYALPGNDVIYELTVTNSGGSPVDASTIVLADMLPANVIFRNSAYDTTTTTNYSFSANSSGVALAAARVTYSNNNGSSYAYTPASGYDTAVDAVRYSPTGTMAANSSFSVRFKAQVK